MIGCRVFEVEGRLAEAMRLAEKSEQLIVTSKSMVFVAIIHLLGG